MATSKSHKSTSISLIDQAKAGDNGAWNRLTELYGSLVYRWARQAGLQDSDAVDVMQNVFRDVVVGLGTFRKQKPEDSFRGWLWVITRNQLHRHFNQHNRQPNVLGGSATYHQMQQAVDLTEMESSLDHSGSRTFVLHRALDIIREEFEERTWQAFWRLTNAEESATEIAMDLGMSEKAVRQAKYRVLCRLRGMLRDDQCVPGFPKSPNSQEL